MKFLPQILQLSNIIVMAFLIIFIIMQNRSQGLSTVFGGSGGISATRRGFEKWLFYATVAMAVLFVGLSVASLIVSTKH